MRFLFVGDSMTIGSAGDFTWRYRIWQHLSRQPDGPYEIVGPRTSLYDPATAAATSDAYADPAFPPPARRHLAGWGEGWLHMAPAIREAVTAARPDILLISLGLIDLGFYTNSTQTIANTHHFITEARAANPRIRLVLLPVIPNIRAATDAPFAAECARFNELLAKTTADLSTPASPLLLASVPPSYTLTTDTYDGTHPSPAGEHKLAASFADAMHQAWTLGGPYQPTPASAPFHTAPHPG
ncbi:GDSL-type esterase/lipase family protein [Streptomyces sp. PR69]|uniref:GDSL-type esterase/lipase family protein n=1 Tax=Streptomyces sp. PR69 TaxID=2984950 RepID=UPI0022656765|nr:GDSL-type esterase/lipase family protein [Streptomyces sp. PR69]